MKLLTRYSRYYVFIFCILFTFIGLFGFADKALWLKIAIAITGIASIVGVVDILQVRYAVRKNYPITGNFRYLLKHFRAEIRQYFIESDYEAVPFTNRDRELVYARANDSTIDSSKAFGTLEDVYKVGYKFATHSINTADTPDPKTFRITIGNDACKQPYSAAILNISAMSFGALSANAVEALNGGAKRGGFYHDTGEGGISPYHRKQGGDLVWELGSGYFGCRTKDGHFDPERFAVQAQDDQIKMIEIKISQGAKPGHGGVLPQDKMTAEIAATREVPIDQDCISPSRHSAFSTPLELIDFIQQLRELSLGKPVGFKLCIGHPWEFVAIAKAMVEKDIYPDFIVVDGKEGGTGAAPVEFTDHMGTPLQEGLLFVHNVLVGMDIRDRIKLGASGKIITAFDIAKTMALGADWVNSARGFLFSLGCIQAQQCHMNTCPTGITTQDQLRQSALIVPDKIDRVANFHKNTMYALAEILASAGVDHPSRITANHIVMRTSESEVKHYPNSHYFMERGGLLKDKIDSQYYQAIWNAAQAESFLPKQAEYVH